MNQNNNAATFEPSITRCLPHDAYSEGAFFAEVDWGWLMSIGDEPTAEEVEMMGVRPSSMAEHCAVSWAFVSQIVFPAWQGDREAQMEFYDGYEGRASELADAGEAGYEALAEAGTVVDTAGWQLQGAPWAADANDDEKALRAVRAAWAGAAAWQAVAEATGEKHAELRAIEALIRAEAAGECVLDCRYVTATVEYAQ
ncbi:MULTISPECIES: hypothetical protein [unclassified Caballeronia]|uniref:hypothetical protein n=1 Tax=unclassified Caballeronia TaxID=2646786 RepID=UPI001F3F3AE5|nr:MULTISPECIES: hypothetical protein [unclassified Caballeronia]MCE4542130.1 hypothetical protein [Caballeronia sp. PC1]MCE4568824.1 hypothetical protein [Caballeronia sp. CLC5]